MKDKLTHFQEQFCREYVKTGNASAAYRAVSVKSRSWGDETVWVAASRMMARSNVGIRIAALQQQAAVRAQETPDSLVAELNEMLAGARELQRFDIGVAAIMSKAKLFGFLIDKKEIRTGALDNLDFEQLRLVNDALATLAIAGPVAGADTSETSH